MNAFDCLGALGTLHTAVGPVAIYRLARLAELGLPNPERLPFSIRVWLEGLLRQCNGREITIDHVRAMAGWTAQSPGTAEVPFMPARVLLQDFTGVPTIVDLAALRSAMARAGGDADRIQPQVPVDLVIDHSVQVDQFASSTALLYNAEREFERNRERYEFLHWAQNAFRGLRVVPPATGIVHQVNLEFLATVVVRRQVAAPRRGGAGGRASATEWLAFPDTLVGTDSHTTMINGLGVMGWGVGGIEAEAVMLGEPITLLPPEVVGFELRGELPEGTTATDAVLTVTQMLRRHGVVGKFVEFYGPGVSRLSLPDRATIANMAPEYGATMGFFPVDDETLRYLRASGRPADLLDLVERYNKTQALFRTDATPAPTYSDSLTLDLGQVEPSLAGPKRPQDRVPLRDMKATFQATLRAPTAQRGYGLSEADLGRTTPTLPLPCRESRREKSLTHGAVVIAAITSCTNTSNPSVMIGAGLLAKKAVERGLRVPSYVKTSLAPGSTVVSRYLQAAGLTPYLDQLGFQVVGYGCTTCIGNSGPLPETVARTVEAGNLVAAAVLSGNRNFEGRINPHVRANYLASPPLVVAYALAGTVDLDLLHEPLGHDDNGQPVFLHDLWPSQAEIVETVGRVLDSHLFREQYADVYTGNETWNAIPAPDLAELYSWDPASTYIREPPFFVDLAPEASPAEDILGARVLALLGDSVTTDHISPAGSIALDCPAGRYLVERGVEPAEFNSYGSRRGNHELMMRGTLANIRLKNLLLPGQEGGITRLLPSGEVLSIYDAAMRYQAEGTPLLLIAGREYGSGSSRDWAAKGVALLGVRAVLAESYERIHRCNLVGMGVLPLQFPDGQNARTLELTGEERFDLTGIAGGLRPGMEVPVRVRRTDGAEMTFATLARLDTPVEVNYYRNGGVLHTVLRRMLQAGGG